MVKIGILIGMKVSKENGEKLIKTNLGSTKIFTSTRECTLTNSSDTTILLRSIVVSIELGF